MKFSSLDSRGPVLSRRRALVIMAAAGGLGLAFKGAKARGASDVAPVRWRGVALGARAEMILYHPNRVEGRKILDRAVLEVRRLENVFSLYKASSALSRLNGAGYLDAPPLDLVRLLSTAQRFGDISGGAFDMTVQPLWAAYARAAQIDGGGSQGPDARRLRAALELVDYRRVDIQTGRIAFAKPAMAITLNGIAQGYVTDRVADLLGQEGIDDILVDLGEMRALGGHPDGRPWRVGVQNPVHRDKVSVPLALRDKALATSGGYGFAFGDNGENTHIFDPRTGRSPKRYESVSVTAPHAVTADALSTAFCCMDTDAIKTVLGKMRDTGAIIVNGVNGEKVTRLGA
ncbi:FAD:protein FMN transferase [Varunaivibrio sulfuroxidans]|uniref:FAD:protein FMN transferase n=1 Tax=Varunaivibrio sulfuroxidans TaxID=1773489 RepID=A0A4R3JFF1_9PROT|nr:FAD:protein FMN transferase [Varunaivibrio sulfuroxidans]TCS63993.1 thiamine biosynthesis lipoprotein [Varunaivibrio sulfuroxidans]WES31554.1 FAD:protein FMN transferase [Varunaivibrio sulfuroxidans]